jgi:hypothetical protein
MNAEFDNCRSVPNLKETARQVTKTKFELLLRIPESADPLGVLLVELTDLLINGTIIEELNLGPLLD